MTLNPRKADSKKQYRVVVDIPAPIDKCFDAGTAEAAMMYWVPGPRSIVYDHSRAKAPYGAGSQRTVTLNSGMSLVEKIAISEKPNFLAYGIATFGMVGDLLMSRYQGHMHFEVIDNNHTRLTWIGHFDCSGLQRITEPLTRFIMRTLIATMAKRLVKYFELKAA